MPNETEMDDGMDDMYPSDEGMPPEKETPDTIDEEAAEEASNTALVPKAMLSGFKIGEIVKMRVAADHGDELELEAVSSSKETSKPTMSADEELDSMSKEY